MAKTHNNKKLNILFITIPITINTISTMSSFTTAISNINKTNPQHEILDVYKQCMLDLIVCTTTMSIPDVNKSIEAGFLRNKKHIINLIFSNNKNIYMFHDKIINIKYFKYMFDGYDFGDNIIVDVVVDKMFDDYNVMEIIMDIFDNNKCYRCKSYS